MKQIVKGSEPVAFSNWKARDRMKHRPNWRRVRPPIKRQIHESLLKEQGFLCCYCEVRVAIDCSHVEHFRPRETYPDLALDYANLHCSCQRESSPGEPRRCGHRKGSWFDENLLISPQASDCEARFRFTAHGDIFPMTARDAGASATIQKLGLNIDKLRALRASAIDALFDESPANISRLLECRMDGKFLPFYTTIKQVLAP